MKPQSEGPEVSFARTEWDNQRQARLEQEQERYAQPHAPRTNGMAVASMVLGILWLSWIGSVLAVIFGHYAMSQINKDPNQTGKGMAIAGIVLGYVGVGFLVLFILAAATHYGQSTY